MQKLVLTTLAELAEPPARLQNSTDVEIRRMALETLLRILESNGHALVTGWNRIFHILRTACPPANLYLPPIPSPSIAGRYSLDTISEREGLAPSTPIRASGSNGGYFLPVAGGPSGDASARAVKGAALVRTSFPSLQLICTDFLEALTVDELRDCIGTLADFGKQGDDVNVALTVRSTYGDSDCDEHVADCEICRPADSSGTSPTTCRRNSATATASRRMPNFGCSF